MDLVGVEGGVAWKFEDKESAVGLQTHQIFCGLAYLRWEVVACMRRLYELSI